MPGGAGTLITAKCPGSGTHCASNARGLLEGGGMLADGIDLHIIFSPQQVSSKITLFISYACSNTRRLYKKLSVMYETYSNLY